MSGCKLEDTHADQLANALSNNVKVTELDISFNHITAKGGQALLKAVSQSMCSVAEVFSVGNSALSYDRPTASYFAIFRYIREPLFTLCFLRDFE